MTDLTGALEAVLAMQRAGEEIEVYGVHKRVTTIQAETGGTIRQVDQSETLGIGVRLIKGQQVGYASSSDFDIYGLTRCVEQARSHADLSKPHPTNRLPPLTITMPRRKCAGNRSCLARRAVGSRDRPRPLRHHH